MVTQVIGLIGPGQTYATPNAWWASIPSSPVAADSEYIGRLINSGSQLDQAINFSGAKTTDATRRIIFEAVPGGSFRDHANKLTNKLYPNAANGACMYSSQSALYVNTNAHLTIRNLQFIAVGNGIEQQSGNPNLLLENLLVATDTSSSGSGAFVTHDAKLVNCIGIVTSTGSCYVALSDTIWKFCTAVQLTSGGGGYYGYRGNYSNPKAYNCAAFGFSQGFKSGDVTAPSNYNASGTTGAPGANSVPSLVMAEQFVNFASAGTADLRLLPTNDLQFGSPDADTGGVDILGRARNGTTPTVGAMEFIAADTTNPTLSGSITTTSITQNSYTLSWPAGADNVAVTGYDLSLNGGSSYADVGNVLTFGVTGRTPSATDQVRIRARDADGNTSTPVLSTSVTLLAPTDNSKPTMNGAISVTALLPTSYTLTWPAASDNVAVTGYEVSLNGGTSYSSVGNVLTTNITGRTPSSTDAVRVRAFDAAGNRPDTPLASSINLPATADTTKPVMVPSLVASSITQTTYTLTWPAATDAIGVVGYELSLDNGSSYTPVGNVLTTNVTGRTAAATDQVRLRAYDAAGNRADTPLTASVPLAAASLGSITMAKLVNNTDSPQALALVTWNWIVGGRMGDLDGKTILKGQTTTNSNGDLIVTGLPTGDGCICARISGSGPTTDKVYYKAGTVV